jgi:hypothetical protein
MDELYNYFTFFSLTFMIGYYIVNNNEIQQNITRKLYQFPNKKDYKEIQNELSDENNIINEQPIPIDENNIINEQPIPVNENNISNENNILIDILMEKTITNNDNTKKSIDILSDTSSSSGSEDGFVFIKEN